MKYIIAENRMSKIIHNYLDEMFPEDQMQFEHPLETIGSDFVEDKCRIKFNLGDDYDGAFYYYEKCFWGDLSEKNYRNRILLKEYNPPYLDIEEPFRNVLRGMFGDHLDEPFKQWFTNRYKLPLNKIG